MADKIDFTTILPRFLKTGSTGASTTITFNVTSTSHCWIVVVSKDGNDGTLGGVFFIRQGAKGIAAMATTGGTLTYSVSKTETSSGFTITMINTSANMNYAKYTVYEVQ